jgi:hypothetical protein
MKKIYLSLALGIIASLTACSSSPSTITNTTTSTAISTYTLTSTSTVTVTSTVTSPTTITSTQTVTSSATSTTSTSTGTTTSFQTTTSGSTVSTTFGQLAVQGKDVYTVKCTQCHAFIGAYGRSVLASYQDAASLLRKIATMPPSIGMVTQERWEVLSYLLVANNLISGDTPFNPDSLSQVLLTL